MILRNTNTFASDLVHGGVGGSYVQIQLINDEKSKGFYLSNRLGSNTLINQNIIASIIS